MMRYAGRVDMALGLCRLDSLKVQDNSHVVLLISDWSHLHAQYRLYGLQYYPMDSLSQSQEQTLRAVLPGRYQGERGQLDLRYMPDAWTQVLAIPIWAHLQTLGLDSCSITDNNIQALAQACLKNLLELQLGLNMIGSAGMHQLLSADFTKLTSLRLTENPLGSAGVKALVKMHLPRIQEIIIGGCGIGNEGAKHVVKCNWPELRKLYMYGNRINMDGRVGLYALHSSTRMEEVRTYYEQVKNRKINQFIGAPLLVLVASSWLRDMVQTQNRKLEKCIKGIFGNKRGYR